MKKGKRNFLITLVVVLVIAIIAIAWWVISLISGPTYYAVYLNTGDIYFGELSTFPRTTLNNAWYLQQDFENQQLALASFKNVVWGPVGDIQLSESSIVWIAEVSDDSQIIPILEGQQQPQQAAPQQQVPGTVQQDGGDVVPQQ